MFFELKYLLTFVISFIVCNFSFAQTLTQEVMANGGGFYSQINGSLQFTIGETLVETYKTSGSVLYQGFQQGSYEIVNVSENKHKINSTIYPNPTTDFVTISLESSISKTYTYSIFTIEGVLLLKNQINNNESKQIDLSKLSNGLYFISIVNNEIGYQKFIKIIKTL